MYVAVVVLLVFSPFNYGLASHAWVYTGRQAGKNMQSWHAVVKLEAIASH
jgi:hypothetical protein